MVFGMSLYQALSYFLIYSFLGWVAEVIFHAVHLGKVVNRGFLNGPVCPIYGCGVLSVFALSHFLQADAVELVPLWQLFLFGMALATAVELAGGFLLDKLFHARWWDYSDKPLNFHGYICLEFSLLWGLAVAFVVRVIQPYFRQMAGYGIPERIGWPILAVLYAVFAADLILTVIAVVHLNRRLAEAERLEKTIRSVSDGLTELIGGSAYKTRERLGSEKARAESAGAELKERVLDARENLAQAAKEREQMMTEKRQELFAWIARHRHFGAGRLLRAFPKMQHRAYPAKIRELQEYLQNFRKNK